MIVSSLHFFVLMELLPVRDTDNIIKLQRMLPLIRFLISKGIRIELDLFEFHQQPKINSFFVINQYNNY